MIYFVIPLLFIAFIALMCLNIKIGFIVGYKTANTGFDAGWYMITVVGLTAFEISAVVYVLNLIYCK